MSRIHDARPRSTHKMEGDTYHGHSCQPSQILSRVLSGKEEECPAIFTISANTRSAIGHGLATGPAPSGHVSIARALEYIFLYYQIAKYANHHVGVYCDG